MRFASIVRMSLILMFVASIAVAGTAVVMQTAQTLMAETNLASTTDGLMDVQVDQLERQLRSYQVRLAGDGTLPGRINIIDPLTGRVATAREMTIAFLQNGRIVREIHPGIEGRFQVNGLQPGVYAVVGAGPDGYVAYTLQVLPAELTVENSPGNGVQPVAFQEVEAELAIDSVAVPLTDLPTIVGLAQDNIPPELLQADPSGPGFAPGESIADQRQAGQDRDVALSGHQVRIQADGTLIGRVHRLNQSGEPTRIRRLNVFLVQDNTVVSQAPVDELGTFRFFDVPDGIYSFVAAGMEGMAAFTMQAVSGPGLAADVADELTLVAFDDGGGASGGGVVGGEDLPYAYDAASGNGGGEGDEGEGGGEGGGAEGGEGGGEGGGGGGTPGGGGGTAGGGGGPGGGESGLGALLGAAALGLAGYAAADDDDNNNVVSNPNP